MTHRKIFRQHTRGSLYTLIHEALLELRHLRGLGNLTVIPVQ